MKDTLKGLLTSFSSIMILSMFINIASPKTADAQQKLEWHAFEDAILIADSTKKPIFIDVWAPWCGWCLKMKREVYPDLNEELSEKFILTRLNRDDNETRYYYKNRYITPFMLSKILNVKTVPEIVFLNLNGDYLTNLSGFIHAEDLQPVLEYISSEAYKDNSFQNFLNK